MKQPDIVFSKGGYWIGRKSFITLLILVIFSLVIFIFNGCTNYTRSEITGIYKEQTFGESFLKLQQNGNCTLVSGVGTESQMIDHGSWEFKENDQKIYFDWDKTKHKGPGGSYKEHYFFDDEDAPQKEAEVITRSSKPMILFDAIGDDNYNYKKINNELSKKEIDKLTKKWEYDKVNVNGQEMSADQIGNPTMEFKKDSTYNMDFGGMSEEGEWLLSGGYLTTISKKNDQLQTLYIKELEKDKMIVEGVTQQGKMTITLIPFTGDNEGEEQDEEQSEEGGQAEGGTSTK